MSSPCFWEPHQNQIGDPSPCSLMDFYPRTPVLLVFPPRKAAHLQLYDQLLFTIISHLPKPFDILSLFISLIWLFSWKYKSNYVLNQVDHHPSSKTVKLTLRETQLCFCPLRENHFLKILLFQIYWFPAFTLSLSTQTCNCWHIHTHIHADDR